MNKRRKEGARQSLNENKKHMWSLQIRAVGKKTAKGDRKRWRSFRKCAKLFMLVQVLLSSLKPVTLLGKFLRHPRHCLRICLGVEAFALYSGLISIASRGAGVAVKLVVQVVPMKHQRLHLQPK